MNPLHWKREHHHAWIVISVTGDRNFGDPTQDICDYNSLVTPRQSNVSESLRA